jgi:hypothetical protein
VRHDFIDYSDTEIAGLLESVGYLERIDDNQPKLVLSLDRLQPPDRGGIRWLNLVELLLDKDR